MSYFPWILSWTLAAAPGTAETGVVPEVAEEEQVLKKVNIAVDGPGLLEYFRKQTPSARDLERIAGLIKDLGDNRFRVRDKATKDLIVSGPAALASLRQALKHEDAEVRKRSGECIEAIEHANEPTVAVAAVRLLRVRRPSGTSGVLLSYLPLVKDETVEEELVSTLVATSVTEGKVDAGVASALKDKAASRKAAAALILGRYGSAEQKTAVRQLLKDADPKVRYRAAQGLVAGREKAAVATLVSLLGEGPIDVAQAADDLLGRMAGAAAPTATLGEKNDERRKCHETWDKWWKANEAKIDLAKADVDLNSSNPTYQAREVVKKFTQYWAKGDMATFKKVTDVPFSIYGQQTINTREELEQMFGGNGGGGIGQITFTAEKVVTRDEYLKNSENIRKGFNGLDSGGEKGFLNKMRNADVRVVYVSMKQGAQEAGGIALFVKLTGGRARVVGYGMGQQPKR